MMYKYFLFISIILAFCYEKVNAHEKIEEYISDNQGYIWTKQGSGDFVGGTLVSKNILFTTANAIMNEKEKYSSTMLNNPVVKSENPIIRVIYYDYQKNRFYNNFGLLIFPNDLTRNTKIKPAILLDPKINFENLAFTYVTGVIWKEGEDETVGLNKMRMIKCKSKLNNDQTICNIIKDEGDCNTNEGGAMFAEVKRNDKSTYFALTGVVVGLYAENLLCDEDEPVVVLRTNIEKVYNWIQSI